MLHLTAKHEKKTGSNAPSLVLFTICDCRKNESCLRQSFPCSLNLPKSVIHSVFHIIDYIYLKRHIFNNIQCIKIRIRRSIKLNQSAGAVYGAHHCQMLISFHNPVNICNTLRLNLRVDHTVGSGVIVTHSFTTFLRNKLNCSSGLSLAAENFC